VHNPDDLPSRAETSDPAQKSCAEGESKRRSASDDAQASSVRSVTDPAARPVTRASRSFGEDEVAALEPERRRMLCHGLLIGDGVSILQFRSTAEFDEFATQDAGSWRPRSMVVRIFHGEVRQGDLDHLLEDSKNDGALEALAVCALPLSDEIEPPFGVHIVTAAEFADRVVRSPLVRWDDAGPEVAPDRVELLMKLDETAALLDPVGIRWLPSAALNELPPDLASRDLAPQDLLERKAFRILTAVFCFGGLRYGESARGKRLPDSVLFWPDGSPTSALVDCKAASSGYRMEPDHLLRFVEYWDNFQPRLAEEGRSLDYLIVVSSHFQGVPGERHPYFGRADDIAERTGMKLVYLQASDLAWAAARAEAQEMPLPDRASIDWRAAFDEGLVSSEHVERSLDGVA
jgi:hypothetical protein